MEKKSIARNLILYYTVPPSRYRTVQDCTVLQYNILHFRNHRRDVRRRERIDSGFGELADIIDLPTNQTDKNTFAQFLAPHTLLTF
jgi:hypothetical protein